MIAKIREDLRDLILNFINPYHKIALQLRSVGMKSEDILPMINNLYKVMKRMNGSDIRINDLAYLFIQVHCKGCFTNEEFVRLKYNGVDLLPELKSIKDTYDEDINIRYEIKSGKVSSGEFIEAVRLYLNK